MQSLLEPPIGFAHRGARAHAPENTIEAFKLALKLGATGLESDVWLTADGVPVLDHDGVVRQGLRRRTLADVRRSEVGHLPTLDDLYEVCGNDYALSLDVKDDAAAGPVVAAATAAGAVGSLWLCHPEWRTALGFRDLHADVQVVDSTRLRKMREGPERRAALLAEAGVDAVNLHESDWTGGLTALFHRFEVKCFAWDAQQPRTLAKLLAMGVDAVYSDYTDRMMQAILESRR